MVAAAAASGGNLQFFEPHDLAFGNGRMYVADTDNNRVQMFQP